MNVDAWLVERADALVGRLQARGVPLPAVLAEMATACIVADAVYVAASAVGGRHGHAAVFALIVAPWVLITLRKIRVWRADAERVEVQAVQERLRSDALLEREMMGWARLLYLTCSPLVVLVALTTPVRAVDLAILAGWLAFLAFGYARCALPRLPDRTVREAPDLAYGGAS